jgi:hypothetical protein
MTSPPRKQFVMFADIAGSSQIFERLGDTEAMHAVERCLKRMGRAIDSFHGRTVKIVGDELLATFDTAENACQGAIDMQQRVADIPPVSGLKLAIRIGLHVGMVSDTDDELSGDAVTNTARIVGAARRDQILCSSELVSELGPQSPLKLRPMSELGNIAQDGEHFDIFQIEWSMHPVPGQFSVLSIMPPTRLSICYRDQNHLLDDKMRVLTVGRDLSNKVHIDDRKASRSHARIEKRNSGFYLVDTSTNGTFVSFAGRQEVLVKRNEILLEGTGTIGFGASKTDPTATCADFEYL